MNRRGGLTITRGEALNRLASVGAPDRDIFAEPYVWTLSGELIPAKRDHIASLIAGQECFNVGKRRFRGSDLV